MKPQKILFWIISGDNNHQTQNTPPLRMLGHVIFKMVALMILCHQLHNAI